MKSTYLRFIIVTSWLMIFPFAGLLPMSTESTMLVPKYKIGANSDKTPNSLKRMKFSTYLPSVVDSVEVASHFSVYAKATSSHVCLNSN